MVLRDHNIQAMGAAAEDPDKDIGFGTETSTPWRLASRMPPGTDKIKRQLTRGLVVDELTLAFHGLRDWS
jgi:hypothetical protein